jgi:hypothetical protein
VELVDRLMQTAAGKTPFVIRHASMAQAPQPAAPKITTRR